ncbi:hypothetical protein [Lysinibacter cavernae]
MVDFNADPFVKAWVAEEWVAVFGHRSRAAFELLKTSASWVDHSRRAALIVTVPRVICGFPDQLSELLRFCSTHEEIQNSTGPRMNIFPSPILDISMTTYRAHDSAQQTAQYREASAAFREQAGITWTSIFRLFTRRGWPTYILHDNASKIAKQGKSDRTRILKEVQTLRTVREVDLYFDKLT